MTQRDHVIVRPVPDLGQQRCVQTTLIQLASKVFGQINVQLQCNAGIQAAETFDNGHTKLFLKLANALQNCGLGDVQTFGGSGETTQAVNPDKGLKLLTLYY